MGEPSEAGSWRRILILGSGAFGEVSLWKNYDTGENIAIKKCKFALTNSLTDRQCKRWHNEVDIMQTLSHPNIVGFKQLPDELKSHLNKFNPTKLPLLSMEYCEKGSLRQVLKEPENWCGLEENVARSILSDITDAIWYLHQHKITHRDIKPDNIVLQHCDNRANKTIYKLIDLGYAKELNDSTVSFVGTLHYLAPEIFETDNYTSAVDYWSLGILTFEVICGVLPFLPHLNPAERFSYIKKKKPEHICIYLSHAGSLKYSTEIKNENFISSCLRKYIESWLKHLFQYDSAKRSEPFSDGTNVFSFLQIILRKKIVIVFSMYDLKFLSYEITEATLVGELKDKIFNDTDIDKNDQILLTNKCFKESSDNDYVINILNNVEDMAVFLIKRDDFILDHPVSMIPKVVKTLFQKTLKPYGIRDTSAHSIYYICWESKIMSCFFTGINLYIKHCKTFTEKLTKNYESVSTDVRNLSMMVKSLNLIRKNNASDLDLSDDENYQKCILNGQRLLSNLERRVLSLYDLRTKISVLFGRINFLEKVLPNVIKSCDLTMYITKAKILTEKKACNVVKDADFYNRMREIVSNMLREKDRFLRSEDLKNSVGLATGFHKYSENLIAWMHNFQACIFELSKAFELNEIERSNFIKNPGNPRSAKTHGMVNGLKTDISADNLIEENIFLMIQFNNCLDVTLSNLSKFPLLDFTGAI